ncbi:hypothetical protein GOP47_0023905 [Adiantum capillus-veneris]|uniref:Uncharacterized protein n=1 Tax=Adiantum capillus-veneris TaxID=13818 RepID=A0A9D4U4W0_ADICA|nr:hypothetical protein GOP47_0023905 [Adiantum capillus-veneris]
MLPAFALSRHCFKRLRSNTQGMGGCTNDGQVRLFGGTFDCTVEESLYLFFIVTSAYPMPQRVEKFLSLQVMKTLLFLLQKQHVSNLNDNPVIVVNRQPTNKIKKLEAECIALKSWVKNQDEVFTKLKAPSPS